MSVNTRLDGFAKHAIPVPAGHYFFLIGAMKAGTSTMYRHLAAHPSIYAAPRKEPRFFSKPAPTRGEVAAYARLFAGRTRESWAFEASTAYTKYPMISGVASRMHSAFPDARLIYLIRNPVDRICSAYLHNQAEGRERRSFEDAVFDRSEAYLHVSRYHMQICEYLRVFPRERLLVLLFEEFIADVGGTLTRIAKFLDLDVGFSPVSRIEHDNETARKRVALPVFGVVKSLRGFGALPWRVRQWASKQMSQPLPSKGAILDEHVRDRLVAELDEDISRLESLLETDLSCWRASRCGIPGRQSRVT